VKVHTTWQPTMVLRYVALFWALDWIADHLIWLAIVNQEDCHYKFQTWIWNVKSRRGDGEESLLFYNWSHRSFALNLMYLEQYLTFECIVQSHSDILAVSNELCHIPLKYRCLIKKSATISYPLTLGALASLLCDLSILFVCKSPQ
jgi:hypothetical protein